MFYSLEFLEGNPPVLVEEDVMKKRLIAAAAAYVAAHVKGHASVELSGSTVLHGVFFGWDLDVEDGCRMIGGLDCGLLKIFHRF